VVTGHGPLPKKNQTHHDFGSDASIFIIDGEEMTP